MPRPAKYPWDSVEPGVITRWVRGEDFDCEVRTLQCTMTKAARSRGYSVISRSTIDSIYFAWVRFEDAPTD